MLFQNRDDDLAHGLELGEGLVTDLELVVGQVGDQFLGLFDLLRGKGGNTAGRFDHARGFRRRLRSARKTNGDET